jgi:hypothetical protein
MMRHVNFQAHATFLRALPEGIKANVRQNHKSLDCFSLEVVLW